MKKQLFKWLVVLGIFFLLLTFAMRAFNDKPLMPGSQGYGHARIAATIARTGVPKYDPTMPQRQYAINLFDLVLACFAMLIGIEAAAIILPLLFGIAALLCIYAALKKWGLLQDVLLSILLVFVVSPFFVSAFAQAIPFSMELSLLSLFLLLLSPSANQSAKKTTFLTLLAVVVAAFLATFSIFTALAAFALPMLLRTVNKRVPVSMAASSISAFIVLVTFTLPQFLQHERVPFGKPVPVVQAISDFGGAGGLSLFAWLLALIGFVLLWQFKKKYYAAMIAVGITLFLSLIIPSVLPIAHLLTAFLAGNAFAFLAKRKWVFDDIKIVTVFVLVCGLLFSTLTHCIALARGPPTKDIRDAAIAVKALFPENTVVLSHPNNGFWLEYWSARQLFIDGWPALTPDVANRWAAAEAIWHSQDITNARALLYKNKIGAIAITKDMRDGLVWDLPEQDLLFLLRNNETFENAYRSPAVEIWKVLPAR